MNQFETEHNPAAYTHTLGKQLTDTLPNIDYFVAGVGSGGTFTGVAQHLKQYNVKNVIVEPEGSILNGGEHIRMILKVLVQKNGPSFGTKFSRSNHYSK